MYIKNIHIKQLHLLLKENPFFIHTYNGSTSVNFTYIYLTIMRAKFTHTIDYKQITKQKS